MTPRIVGRKIAVAMPPRPASEQVSGSGARSRVKVAPSTSHARQAVSSAPMSTWWRRKRSPMMPPQRMSSAGKALQARTSDSSRAP